MTMETKRVVMELLSSMATRRGYITKNENPQIQADGIMKARDNGVIGRAKNRQGPNGTYIDFQLEGYWLITEEDKKLLEKTKKQNNG